MTQVIRRTAVERSAPDATTATGLWWAQYSAAAARRVLWPYAACAAAPDPALELLRWRLRPDGSVLLGNVRGSLREGRHQLPRLVDSLLHQHLEPLIERLADDRTLGRRGLRALAVSAILTAAGGAPATDRRSRWRLVDDVTELLPSTHRRLAEVGELCAPGEDWQPCAVRLGCCLAYRIDPPGAHCGTCHLVAEPERVRRLGAAGYRWRRRPGSP